MLSFLLSGLLACWCAAARAPELPEPVGPVNDFAGVIGAKDREVMEALGMSTWKATYAELAVATVRTAAPWDLPRYAQALMRHWNLGVSRIRNGVLLLAAVDERRVHIEVGPDLGVILPRAFIEQIITRKIEPHLSRGDYSKGLRTGFESIARAVFAAAEHPPLSAPRGLPLPAAEGGVPDWALLAFMFVLAAVFMLFLVSRMSGHPAASPKPSPAGFGQGQRLGRGQSYKRFNLYWEFD